MELLYLDIPFKNRETVRTGANVCQLYNKFAGFICFVLLV
jgi:hypothetical protein